ncbi:MAG: hypothetical protein WD751_01820 [Anaerolineales bacterium]
MKSSLLFLCVLALILSACAGATDQSALQTAAAGTLNAEVATAQAANQSDAALQTSEAENAALQATVNALATANAQIQAGGTATAAAQATLSAIPPQVVPPDGAICRSGPDAGFGKVADLAPGQPVLVYGRATNGEWWQVANPEQDGSTCWVFWEDDFDFLGDVFNLPLLAGPTLPTPTFAPTHAPGISARYVDNLTCSGTRYAIVRVLNLGPETYQSAIVKLSDVNGDEIRRSDGNNEFLPTSTTCPGGEGPILKPGGEAFVAVSLDGVASGATVSIRVTVCTETGYKGNCWSSAVTFIP